MAGGRQGQPLQASSHRKDPVVSSEHAESIGGHWAWCMDDTIEGHPYKGHRGGMENRLLGTGVGGRGCRLERGWGTVMDMVKPDRSLSTQT